MCRCKLLLVEMKKRFYYKQSKGFPENGTGRKLLVAQLRGDFARLIDIKTIIAGEKYESF